MYRGTLNQFPLNSLQLLQTPTQNSLINQQGIFDGKPVVMNALWKRSTERPFPGLQSTCRLVGQTSIPPPEPSKEHRAGPVFQDQGNNCIVPPGSEVRLTVKLSVGMTLVAQALQEVGQASSGRLNRGRLNIVSSL